MDRAILVTIVFLYAMIPAKGADRQVPLPDTTKLFLAQIHPALGIVTEVSIPDPYVGQQLSIIYSLRVLRSPTAVDIQPQQYSGFWTEIVPLPEQTRTAARVMKGLPADEFLLRQVIAYPLTDGELQLPPLAVKIRMADTPGTGSDHWDLVAESKPISIRVRPIPKPEGTRITSPFVGSVTGSLTEVKGASSEVLLEMSGAANLAFFEPADWLRMSGGTLLSPRIVNVDNRVQTLDMGGKRQLLLTQRRQWSVKVLSAGPDTRRIEDIVIPVFRPETRKWSFDKIEGISLSSPTKDPSPQPAMPTRSSTQAESSQNFVSRGLFIVVSIPVALFLGWLWWKQNKASSLHGLAPGNLELLEKQSRAAPRSFLETAHRMIERYAKEKHLARSPGTEDSPFDECWSLIEKHRFTAGDPPVEVRARILQSLRLLLRT